MDVGSSPVASLTVLVLSLPGVFLAGRAMSRWLGGSTDVRSVVGPSLTVSIWLLAIHVVGLATRSFRIGFVLGTSAVALVGFGLWVRERRLHFSRSVGGPFRIRRSDWIGALLCMCFVAPMAVEWCMHDEVLFVGHLSIPAQMHNDIYPPRYASMPSILLRYHYGFDLLVACTSILTRLRMDRAIDLVTLICLGHTFLLLCVLGRRILGGRGIFCAFVALFGAGLPMATPHAPLDISTMLGICQIEGLWLNPPLISYFFQHPWTLGLPIALSATLVAMDSKSSRRRRMLTLVLLLVMLSLSQVVLFLSLSGALFVREAFHGPTRLMLRRSVAMLLLLGCIAVLAYAMGGFFTPLPGGTGFGIVFRPGVVSTLVGNFQWIASTFGLLVPLGLAGFFFVRRERIFLATLLAGSAAVFLLFHYEKTWDILKFAVITALVLGILASATIARLAAIRPRFVSIPVAIVLVAVTTMAGLAHPVIFGANLPGIPHHWIKDPPELSPDDVRAVTWLRRHIRPGEIAYRRDPMSIAYVVWGGIPQAWIHNERSFGLDPRAIAARDHLLQTRPAEKNAWRAQGIRFFVLSPLDKWERGLTSRWEKARQAKTVARIGSLDIIEIFD